VTRLAVRTLLSVLATLSLASAGASASDGTKTTLTISGMTCGGCATAVKIQLKRTEGVTGYVVSYEKGEAVVTYDPARTTPERIAESISKTGFKASVKGGKKPTSEAIGTGKELRGFIAWLPMLAADDAAAAGVQAATFHQLRSKDGADRKLCLDPARLRRETLALLQKRG
jgi:copper chaperone CopZ